MSKKLKLNSDHEPIQHLYTKLESLVVEGNHAECRSLLEATSPKKIPRAWATKFGELSYRVQLPSFTLKVLHRFIYPDIAFETSATDSEKIVYGSALYSFGAIFESLMILDSVKSEENPEILFHKAGANFCAWNYESGIPFFKKYIQSNKITPYKRLVGKVNLAAAYIFTCDWESASKLLHDAKAECEMNSYRMLLGNCFELLAQVEIFQGRFEAAFNLLAQSKECLKDQGGIYELYAQKWDTIARCLQTNDPKDIKKLASIREKALQLSHWNTIRECDLFEGLVTKNVDLIRKVVMGTPYEPYRRRVRKLFDTNFIAKGNFQLLVGDRSEFDSEPTVFDPYKKGLASEALYEKPLLLSLYNALTDDFYQPSNIGILFQKIYPDEKFNPYTSPARILQLLRRLNTWFENCNYPIRINFKKSEFSLVSDKKIFLTIQRGIQISANDGKIKELKTHFSNKMFSTSEVCKILNISKTSANRLLAEAIKDGKLEKDAGRLGRTYCFTSQNSKRRSA